MGTRKLNSMRLLEQHHIPYTVLTYPPVTRDAEEVADLVGVPRHEVYKTLVVQPADAPNKPLLALIASGAQLDLKRLAVASGHKKVSMAAHKDAERLTGLQVGGISPLALTHKGWPVFIDQPAAVLEAIVISAGQRGFQIRVGAPALIELLKATVASIS